MVTNPPPYPDRIREPRFAQGVQRRVDYSPNWTDHGLIAPGSDVEDDLIKIIYLLGRGDLLPERYYRRGIDRDDDELLDDYGIKHLHLGGGGSDILLFLVEYDDAVLLLEVQDHRVFRSSPPGSVLRSLHHSAMTNADTTNATRREERVAERSKTAWAGLKPRTKR